MVQEQKQKSNNDQYYHRKSGPKQFSLCMQSFENYFCSRNQVTKTFNFEAIAWYLQLHIQLRFQPSIRSMMIKAISCLHGDGYHIESRTVLSHGWHHYYLQHAVDVHYSWTIISHLHDKDHLSFKLRQSDMWMKQSMPSSDLYHWSVSMYNYFMWL